MNKWAMMVLMGLLAGCIIDDVQRPDGAASEAKRERRRDKVKSCTHTDQPIYRFENFSDGHHFLFDEFGTLLASVNTKDKILVGEFTIYYNTGTREYWGVLDAGGHVISGKYNRSGYSQEREYALRDMTVADKQNAQTRLEQIMRTGIDKMNNRQDRHRAFPREAIEKIKTLRDYAHESSHPAIGEVYVHNGERLRVFQLVEEGVLVQDREQMIYLGNPDGYLDIMVETSEPYVDREMLKPGKYMYVGPWTYTTVDDSTRTIRRFKQVE